VEAVKQLNWEMTVREDSIAAFFSDKLIIDPKGSIGCGNLYKSYQGYCEESGLKSKSINNFTPLLLELCNDSLGHSISHKRSSAGMVIKGLRLREAWEHQTDEENNTSPTDENLSSLLINNQNFLPDLDRPTHPTLLALDKGSNPTLDHTPTLHTLHSEGDDPNSEPLTSFDRLPASHGGGVGDSSSKHINEFMPIILDDRRIQASTGYLINSCFLDRAKVKGLPLV
jgi:hypothetical protein